MNTAVEDASDDEEVVVSGEAVDPEAAAAAAAKKAAKNKAKKARAKAAKAAAAAGGPGSEAGESGRDGAWRGSQPAALREPTAIALSDAPPCPPCSLLACLRLLQSQRVDAADDAAQRACAASVPRGSFP